MKTVGKKEADGPGVKVGLPLSSEFTEGRLLL